MKHHELIDRFVAGVGGLYGSAFKFFSEGIDSPSLAELIDETEVKIAAPAAEGEYSAAVSAPDMATETSYSVLKWAGRHAPTLIFHHGSGDHPYHCRLRSILESGSGEPEASAGINIIATNSPFNGTRKDYYRAIRDLKRFGVLLAGSVVLIEHLVRSMRNQKEPHESGLAMPKIVVAGISLGGWVTNLHHAVLDTADEYRPIFAGAALDALFTDSAYSRLTSRRALAEPEVLKETLGFEALFGARPNRNVFALMARYDQYIRLERQAHIYDENQLSLLEAGHITGASNNKALRRFLLRAFAQPQPREEQPRSSAESRLGETAVEE